MQPPRTSRPLSPRHWLTAILVTHLLLGVLYSVAIPLWEAYDEWGHYNYVRFVTRNFRLPQPEDGNWIANDERHQPPLYYFLTGALTAWIDAPADFFPARNLLFSEDVSAGFNVAVHSQTEAFPYHGTSLALHAARLVSVMLSSLGVWATYAMMRLWLPQDNRTALSAAAIHAFWPQYLFNGSVITNDILASVAVSLLLAALFGWLFRQSPWRFGAAVLLSLLALALSKFSAYGVLAFGAFVFGSSFAVRLFRDGKGRERMFLPAVATLAILLLGGLLWTSGGMERVQDSTVGKRLEGFLATYLDPSFYLGLDWSPTGRFLGHGFRTFWASFGWGNLEAPGWTYAAFYLLMALSAVGLFIRLARQRGEAAGAMLLLGSIGGCLLAPLILALQLGSDFYFPGRYFLSAITPISALMALGCSELWPERLRARAMFGLGICFALLAVALPFTTILPAYAKPALLKAEAERLIEYPLDVRFGDGLRLAGYDLGPADPRPGEPVQLTLYWQSVRPVPGNYILAVKAVGPGMAVLDEKYLFPGRGNFATSLWEPGDFFRETYALQVPADADAPFRAQILVGFLDADFKPVLAATDAAGNPVPSWFGEFKVAGDVPPARPVVETAYSLGDEFALYGYDMKVGPSEIQMALFWEARRPVAADYTVSVALLDGDRRIWAQADGQPRGGAYPTHLWDAEEEVVDSRTLPLPAEIPCGDYSLYLGLYDPARLLRLPVFDGNGEVSPDRAIKVPVQLETGCLPDAGG